MSSYAEPHVGKRIVLRLDLRDFFPSVRAARVRALFRTAGYPPEVARTLAGLCTNVVPADVKLLEGEYLDVDQSALTGESLPVSKAPGDLAYSGSIAKKGEMTGSVIGTGANTFFGRTASLVQSAGSKSHFVKANNAIGDFLIVLAVALAVVMVAVQLHRGDDFLRIAEYALLLLVAAIPVGLDPAS